MSESLPSEELLSIRAASGGIRERLGGEGWFAAQPS